MAKEVGASYIINSTTEDVHLRLQEITGGYGPDVIIEAVGSAPTYELAVEGKWHLRGVLCVLDIQKVK